MLDSRLNEIYTYVIEYMTINNGIISFFIEYIQETSRLTFLGYIWDSISNKTYIFYLGILFCSICK